MDNYKYLLTLAIPTYSRAGFLDESLRGLEAQLRSAKYPVEFIISDNCSPDNTSEIVKKYIDSGMSIKYVKNGRNIGPDRNFVQCLRMAQGKYIWILGDDDHLLEGALDYVLAALNADTYGLVHLENGSEGADSIIVYTEPDKFLSRISYWITFLSGNIVNSGYVGKIDFEKYYPTDLALMPLWMTAAIEGSRNALIQKHLFDVGKDNDNNGGYNFYKVFVENYLNLWKAFAGKAGMSRALYEKEKKRLFINFIIPISAQILFKEYAGRFGKDRALTYMLKNYWNCPYFYYEMLKRCLN